MSDDRRTRRRNQTVQEILDVAIGVMAEEGVAALSVSEVARRMGLRPPSLYQYLPSRMAIYDALFERAAQQALAIAEQYSDEIARDPVGAIVGAQQATLAWEVANPVLAQLLHWRPVPGFRPSARAYAPAVRQVELLTEALRAAVHAGQLAPAAAAEDGVALYTVLASGVISQQLANEPSAPPGQGRFTRLTPAVLEMFFRYYAAQEEAPNDRIVHSGRRPAAD
jgi:AcrR family transcriptional regulator